MLAWYSKIDYNLIVKDCRIPYIACMGMQKWKVYTLDVIGSNDKGWEVNDVHATDHIIEVSMTDPFAFIIDTLKLKEILNPKEPNSKYRCEWIGEAYIEIDSGSRYETGKPLLQLRKICNKCHKEITGNTPYCSKECVTGTILGML